jgi:hypothetical protein
MASLWVERVSGFFVGDEWSFWVGIEGLIGGGNWKRGGGRVRVVETLWGRLRKGSFWLSFQWAFDGWSWSFWQLVMKLLIICHEAFSDLWSFWWLVKLSMIWEAFDDLSSSFFSFESITVIQENEVSSFESFTIENIHSQLEKALSHHKLQLLSTLPLTVSPSRNFHLQKFPPEASSIQQFRVSPSLKIGFNPFISNANTSILIPPHFKTVLNFPK